MEEIQEFRTADFAQACLLKTVGLPLVRAERSQDKFLEFVFSDPDYKAENLIEQYWNGEVLVSARKMMEVVREMKARIHAESRKHQEAQ